MAAVVDIPVLDMRLEEAALSPVLRAACESTGFFYAEHTGLEALQARALDASRAFFALPLDAKLALKASVATNNRGYTVLGEEVLDPAVQSTGDTKEGFYIGREVDASAEEASLPLHGPNVWPPEALLPGWRGVMEEYSAACRALGLRLNRLLALALELPAEHFEQPGYFDAPQLFLRLLRYAPQRSDPERGVYAAGAHTDYGMLTLLATDQNDGLQIQPRVAHLADVGWVDVPARPGAFIVNLGDLLERWTNGRFLSTRHRVINKNGLERFSMPFFWEPNFLCVCQALPSCCTLDRPPQFPPIKAGEYLLSRYKETHATYGGAPQATRTE